MKKLFIPLIVLLLSLMLVGCVSVNVNEEYDYMRSLTVTGDNGVWAKKHYVDEFGLPTNKAYIITATIGTFSNSATNGSDLYVEILGNKNNIEIKLLEYGDFPISVIDDYPNINVKINYNGQTIDLGRARFSESTKRIIIENSLPLMKAFVENSEVIMSIVIDDYGTSKYLFKINTAGFEYTYHEAFVPTVAES